MGIRKNKMGRNKQDSLSKSSEKKGDLLIQVNELMEKLENDYGPLMLEELQKRLVKTIEDFQSDVSSVLTEAFENHRIKYDNLDKKMIEKIDGNEDDVPSFIAEYQTKQKNKK